MCGTHRWELDDLPNLPGAPSSSTAVATTILVLRDGAGLDSPVVGKVPAGAETVVLESRELPNETMRCLVAASHHAVEPLGWVTARRRDGQELLVLKPPKPPPQPQFYTSLPRAGAARTPSGRGGGRRAAATRALHASLTEFVRRSTSNKARRQRGESARRPQEVRL